MARRKNKGSTPATAAEGGGHATTSDGAAHSTSNGVVRTVASALSAALEVGTASEPPHEEEDEDSAVAVQAGAASSGGLIAREAPSAPAPSVPAPAAPDVSGGDPPPDGPRNTPPLEPLNSGFLGKYSPAAVAAFVIVFMLALYVPFMGSYGMHDPWETHYGEVAREMVYGHALSHGKPDWVRPHWENEWFKSKPVLSFWLLGLAMKAFNISDGVDGQLVMSNRTEWGMRLPFVLFGVAGVFAVWLACSRLMNRRTGLLAAFVLATCPQYFFVSRQAMTDMPFVGLVNLAMAFFMLAYFGSDDDREVWVWRPKFLQKPGQKPVEITAMHLFIGVLLLIVVPQFVLFGTFRYMRTAVRLGGSKLFLGGWPHMAPYIALVGTFIYLTWNTRRMRDVLLYACYLAIGIAMLGKGVGGLVLPVGCIACYLVLTGEWRKVFDWREFRVHLMGALMITIPISFPWYHAMVATLGAEFWNEMFGHHHWKRLAVGVHGDTGTFEYYLMQLAIGMFPWAGLVPVALARFMAPRERTPQERARLFVMCWFIVSFALFTLMITKFHHYILPAVPPLAILVAIYLDELLEGKAPRAKAIGLVLALGFYIFIARDLATNQQRLLWLFCYNYAREWPKDLQYGSILWTFAILGGIPILSLALLELRQRAGSVKPVMARFVGVGALVLVAIGFTYFALDKYLVEISPHWTQKEVLREYYGTRSKEKPEPLIAWQMNWRGETFYSGNTVKGFVDANTKLKKYLEDHKGEKIYFMFEKSRLASFKAMLRSEAREKLQVLGAERNNKFHLVVTTL